MISTLLITITIIIASLALQVAQADDDNHATDDNYDNNDLASLTLQVAQADDDDNHDEDDDDDYDDGELPRTWVLGCWAAPGQPPQTGLAHTRRVHPRTHTCARTHAAGGAIRPAQSPVTHLKIRTAPQHMADPLVDPARES